MKTVKLVALIVLVSLVFPSVVVFSADRKTDTIDFVISDFVYNYAGTNDFTVLGSAKLEAKNKHSNTNLTVVDLDIDGNSLYLILDESLGMIVEFAEAKSPYYEYYTHHGANKLIYSPGSYLVETSEGVMVDPTNTANNIGSERITHPSFSTRNQPDSTNENWWEKTNDYIINVPDNNPVSIYGDLNTAILNVVEYWYNLGYTSLIPNGYSFLARGAINDCFMNQGSVHRTYYVDAMEEYVDTYTDYIVDIADYLSFDLDDIRYEISVYSSPCIVGISNNYSYSAYNVTCVGYYVISNTEYLIVHDVNPNTSYDVYMNFSIFNWMGSFSVID